MQTTLPLLTSPRTTRKGAGGTIGFRLNPRELDQLASIAAAEGVSPHEMARRWVLARMRSGSGANDEGLAAVVTRVEGVETRIIAHLGVAIEAVLLASGVMEADEVKRFVREKLS